MAKCDFSNLGKALDSFVKKASADITKAAVKALNDSAFDARKKIETTFPDYFHTRNRNFPKTTRVEKATPQNMTASVSFPSDFMAIHTTGGKKTPEKSKKIAIPLKDLKAKSYTTATGKVKQSYKPKTLLQKAGSASPKGKGRRSKAPFILTAKTGEGYIARPKGDGRNELLYKFQESTQVPKRWDFVDIVADEVDKTLDKNFARRLTEERNKP